MQLSGSQKSGALHGAVEVYGKEWSFGEKESGTGVYACEPMKCEEHQYRESIDMGETELTEEQVGALIQVLEVEWPGDSYDLLRRNCCTFSDEMCVALGVGHIPEWVNSLAGAGARIADAAESLSDWFGSLTGSLDTGGDGAVSEGME